MAIDKKVKKRIAEEWINAFPQLWRFELNTLYKIVGCCVIGIQLIKSPFSEDYSPHFVIYPLWKIDVVKCLDAPFFMIRLKNKKGLQYDIPYEKSSIYIDDAVECLKSQISVPFDGDVSLKLLFEFVDSLFDDMLVGRHPGKQARLFELKFSTALYTGNQVQAQNVLNQIQQTSKSWNMQVFEMWHGKFDNWFQNLQETISTREEFLKQIEANKQDKKISQLKSSELTG